MKHVIIFESVHFVMKAEKILKKQGIPVRLIPTPRHISSDCGMSLEVSGTPVEEIEGILAQNRCDAMGIFDLS
jgi:hypothetical protein